MILTSNAITYTLRRIAEIAFPSLECNFALSPEPQILLPDGISVAFPTPTDANVQDLLSGNALYSEVMSFDGKVGVKVFFLAPDKKMFSCDGRKITANADILSTVFVLLSRYEEFVSHSMDKYGRFEYANSISCRYEIVYIPIVDEYAMLLRKELSANFPDIWIRPRQYRLIPTHDIDFLVRFRSLGQSFKTIGGDLLVRKSMRKMLNSLSLFFKSRHNCENDPYVAAFLKLVEIAKVKKLDSRFYFKALKKGDRDCTYDIFSKAARLCIELAKKNGVGVGLHGGFYSYDNQLEMQYEKLNLESVFDGKISCVRQHFLRFKSSLTPEIWNATGFSNDSTLGFAEHEGFRCGTCHPYPLFDFEADKEMNVVESPLIAMDTTLLQYRSLSDDDALESLCRLNERCKAVEGDFVFLWHNTTNLEILEKFLG